MNKKWITLIFFLCTELFLVISKKYDLKEELCFRSKILAENFKLSYLVRQIETNQYLLWDYVMNTDESYLPIYFIDLFIIVQKLNDSENKELLVQLANEDILYINILANRNILKDNIYFAPNYKAERLLFPISVTNFAKYLSVDLGSILYLRKTIIKRIVFFLLNLKTSKNLKICSYH